MHRSLLELHQRSVELVQWVNIPVAKTEIDNRAESTSGLRYIAYQPNLDLQSMYGIRIIHLKTRETSRWF